MSGVRRDGSVFVTILERTQQASYAKHQSFIHQGVVSLDPNADPTNHQIEVGAEPGDRGLVPEFLEDVDLR